MPKAIDTSSGLPSRRRRHSRAFGAEIHSLWGVLTLRARPRARLSVAAEAARNVERTVASGIDGLRLSVGALPLDQLSNAELAAVLRIPYRQLPAVGAVALLGNDGKLLSTPVYERDAEKPDAFSEADLQALLRYAPVGLAGQTGTALGVPYRGSTGTTRLPIAVRL